MSGTMRTWVRCATAGEARSRCKAAPGKAPSKAAVGISGSRIIRFLVALSLVLGSGRVAYGHWSTSGTGSANTAVPSFQTVLVLALTGTDAPDSALVPGSTADVVLRISNPNPYQVTVYSIEGSGTIVADAGHPLCTPTGVTFTAPATPPVPPITLPPGETLLHLPGAATMAYTSASACQGARFEIPVTLTTRQ